MKRVYLIRQFLATQLLLVLTSNKMLKKSIILLSDHDNSVIRILNIYYAQDDQLLLTLRLVALTGIYIQHIFIKKNIV